MLKFSKSPHADTIYYADLFRIDGKIWMIMGTGKSDAARIASGNVNENDLGRDSIAVTLQDGLLVGRHDLGVQGAFADPSQHPLFAIDVMAYCLDAEATGSLPDRQDELVKVDMGLMAKLSVLGHYPASALEHACSTEVEFEDHASPANRARRLLALMTAARFENVFLVPFMSTVEEKAALYRARSN